MDRSRQGGVPHVIPDRDRTTGALCTPSVGRGIRDRTVRTPRHLRWDVAGIPATLYWAHLAVGGGVNWN